MVLFKEICMETVDEYLMNQREENIASNIENAENWQKNERWTPKLQNVREIR